VRVALGHYRDLFDATSTLASPDAITAARTHLLGMYALPLLHQDATTSAYLRMAPLIADADLDEYFAPFAIPILARADSGEWSLREEMLPWIDVDRLGGDNHGQLLMSGLVIYKWLAACLRWCAQMSCGASSSSSTVSTSTTSPHLTPLRPLQHALPPPRSRLARSTSCSASSRRSTRPSRSCSTTSPTRPRPSTRHVSAPTATRATRSTCAGAPASTARRTTASGSPSPQSASA